MKYPIVCVCQKTLHVPGSAAGSQVTCECGREVEVPSFARLKASVGESSISADLEIEQRLKANELPLETECVNCLRSTIHSLSVLVICEKSEDRNRVRWYEFIGVFVFGLLYMVHLLTRRTEARLVGTDRYFRLPIRICENCETEVKTARVAEATLRLTPLYSRLLDKYPKAHVKLGEL